MRKFAQLSVTVVVALIMSGCGDVYRPVVIPNPPPTPDPKPAHNAFVISNNGLSKGTGMQLNVSGDTNMGVIQLGIQPEHASLNGSGTRVLTANSLSDTASIFVPASTFSIIAKIADVVLPTGFNPSFVTTTETTSFYVGGSGRNSFPPSIAFVNGSNVAGADIQALPGSVGTTISMAETPDTRKLYAASSNGNSVTPINIIDHTFNASIPVTTPVWVTARSDSGRVYVLSQANGSLLEINPVDDSTVPNTVAAGAGANYMSYDSRLNRLYIPNVSASNVTIVSVAGDHAVTLGTLTSFPVAPRVDSVTGKHEPLSCAGSVTPVAVSALPDGSRFYVTGNFVGTCSNANETVTCVAGTLGQPTSSTVCYQESVFLANDFSLHSTIAIPPLSITPGSSQGVCEATRFRLTMASSADSSKVYLGTCDAGGVAVVRTDTDQFSAFLYAPPGAGTSSGGGAPPPQNPVFVLAGQ